MDIDEDAQQDDQLSYDELNEQAIGFASRYEDAEARYREKSSR